MKPDEKKIISIYKYLDCEDFTTLHDLIEKLQAIEKEVESLGIVRESIQASITGQEYYDPFSLEIEYKRLETDEEFTKRVEKLNKQRAYTQKRKEQKRRELEEKLRRITPVL